MNESESIHEGTTTHRLVAMAMGAWKWGYPRGQRQNITRYEARPDKAGVLRWYAAASRLAGGGLTASSEASMRAAYPEAFRFPAGSIHRKLADPEDV
jgi:hypothetical protein